MLFSDSGTLCRAVKCCMSLYKQVVNLGQSCRSDVHCKVKEVNHASCYKSESCSVLYCSRMQTVWHCINHCEMMQVVRVLYRSLDNWSKKSRCIITLLTALFVGQVRKWLCSRLAFIPLNKSDHDWHILLYVHGLRRDLRGKRGNQKQASQRRPQICWRWVQQRAASSSTVQLKGPCSAHW